MAYTPIITASDFNSVIYPEIRTAISRNDNGAILAEAIDTAIQEAKMYLTRYDLIALFGSVADGTSASFSDSYLTRMIKDMAVWHFIQLANPNINYEAAKLRYDEAIKSLIRIQKGGADPQWPYTTHENEPTETTSDSIISYTKEARDNDI